MFPVSGILKKLHDMKSGETSFEEPCVRESWKAREEGSHLDGYGI